MFSQGGAGGDTEVWVYYASNRGVCLVSLLQAVTLDPSSPFSDQLYYLTLNTVQIHAFHLSSLQANAF